MEPIRVLHENVVMDMGGIENLLMNIYRNIDREKVQFDFMVHRDLLEFRAGIRVRFCRRIFPFQRGNPTGSRRSR